jgi:hypothetical protein
MSIDNNENDNLSKFTNFLKQYNAEESRITSTTCYKLLMDLTDVYLKNGKVEAYIRVSDIEKENNLATNHFKDLIDAYFYEYSLDQEDPKSKAIIDLIELFSADFKDEAFIYLDKYAFHNCAEQIYALKLLLLHASLGKRKEETMKMINRNYESFDVPIKNILSKVFSTYPAEGKMILNPKKWWEFWK